MLARGVVHRSSTTLLYYSNEGVWSSRLASGAGRALRAPRRRRRKKKRSMPINSINPGARALLIASTAPSSRGAASNKWTTGGDILVGSSPSLARENG
eukprot:scaffold23884_cov26-Tisochrysis_lutea.AAC.2